MESKSKSLYRPEESSSGDICSENIRGKFLEMIHLLLNPCSSSEMGLFLDIFESMHVMLGGSIFCRTKEVRGGKEFEIIIINSRIIYINDAGTLDALNIFQPDYILILKNKIQALRGTIPV